MGICAVTRASRKTVSGRWGDSETGAEGLHHDRSSEILIHAGAQNRLAPLSQRLKILVPHESVLDVLRQISICIRQRDVSTHGGASV